jgi:hypothetical protein
MSIDADEPLNVVKQHVNRSDSIYALAVTKVVNCGWHPGTVRLVVALFFTVFLQLALVGLLWQVSTVPVLVTHLRSQRTLGGQQSGYRSPAHS